MQQIVEGRGKRASLRAVVGSDLAQPRRAADARRSAPRGHMAHFEQPYFVTRLCTEKEGTMRQPEQ